MLLQECKKWTHNESTIQNLKRANLAGIVFIDEDNIFVSSKLLVQLLKIRESTLNRWFQRLRFKFEKLNRANRILKQYKINNSHQGWTKRRREYGKVEVRSEVELKEEGKEETIEFEWSFETETESQQDNSSDFAESFSFKNEDEDEEE
jgi:hypothetical protein